mmetsp:Transcript_23105/g.39097  ORF Transcript_23105/g.39097 Transcript_23105/m.39097 type:complete len:526 (+) Transcript_23105:95-1672(+)
MSSLLRQEMDKKNNDDANNDDDNDNADDDEDTYTVKKGETLTCVSLKNNISIASLKKFNRLYGRNSLYTGQVLQLKNPALQPKTWQNVSAKVDDRALAAASLGPLPPNIEVTPQKSFTRLKDISDKQVSFIEKERLKSKSFSTRSLLDTPTGLSSTPTTPPIPPLTPTTSTALKKGSSFSFKYKHNSNPDLKSLVDQQTPVATPKPETLKKRRQSTTLEPGGPDWSNFTDLDDSAPMSIPTSQPQQSSSSKGPFSLSSVPKTLLFGTLEMLESYFPSTFTPPATEPGPLLEKDEGGDKEGAMLSKKYTAFHTELHGNSKILLHSHINCLVDHFPTSLQHEAWDLLFSTELHGSDLTSFYTRSGSCQFSLLVVRTMDNQVFGGFATEPWKITKHGHQAFYGTGECFLFRCHPFTEDDENDCPENDNVDVFDWKYDNYFFQWSNSKQIAMGGGGGCFGFVLDDDFAYAETNPCETFGNPHLTTHREPFAVAEVELWGFAPDENPMLKKDAFGGRGSRENLYMMSYES